MTCAGCNSPVPPSRGGPPRKWCSDRCRRHTMYSRPCRTCGKGVYDGTTTPPDQCGDCRYAQTYGEQNERIFAAWNRGETAWSIAKREGLKPHAVASRVRNHRLNHGRDDLKLHRRRNRELWGELERLWNEGLTYGEIAARLGTTEANVGMTVQVMRGKGYELPHRTGASTWSPDEIVTWWNEGLSLTSLAERIGLTPGSTTNVLTRLRREGFDLPYRRRGPRSERRAA